jgi:hypothetical protein
MPIVRIAASTQGLILGVVDVMVMHATRAKKGINWHTFPLLGNAS